MQRLQLGPQLTRVLRSTDPIEVHAQPRTHRWLSRARTVARSVTRFRDGEMALGWTAAGMSERGGASAASRDTASCVSCVLPSALVLKPTVTRTEGSRKLRHLTEVPRHSGHLVYSGSRQPNDVGCSPLCELTVRSERAVTEGASSDRPHSTTITPSIGWPGWSALGSPSTCCVAES